MDDGFIIVAIIITIGVSIIGFIGCIREYNIRRNRITFE